MNVPDRPGSPEGRPAGAPEPTPHPVAPAAVGRALEALEAAGRLPLDERPAALEQVHAALADALAAVEGA